MSEVCLPSDGASSHLLRSVKVDYLMESASRLLETKIDFNGGQTRTDSNQRTGDQEFRAHTSLERKASDKVRNEHFMIPNRYRPRRNNRRRASRCRQTCLVFCA